jgi:hypothetical protein
MAAYNLLLASDADSINALLFFWNLGCVFYAIFLFCMLHGIMTKTKRSNEFLSHLISFQKRSSDPASAKRFATPDLPNSTSGSYHLEPANEPISTGGFDLFFLAAAAKK